MKLEPSKSSHQERFIMEIIEKLNRSYKTVWRKVCRLSQKQWEKSEIWARQLSISGTYVPIQFPVFHMFFEYCSNPLRQGWCNYSCVTAEETEVSRLKIDSWNWNLSTLFPVCSFLPLLRVVFKIWPQCCWSLQSKMSLGLAYSILLYMLLPISYWANQFFKSSKLLMFLLLLSTLSTEKWIYAHSKGSWSAYVNQCLGNNAPCTSKTLIVDRDLN